MGGTVTLGQSVPLILFSFKRGKKFGLISGILCGVIKIMLSLKVIPVTNFLDYILTFMLDYILPYILVGISCMFVEFLKNKKHAIIVSCIIAHLLKFCCFYTSAVIVWSKYVPYTVNVSGYCFWYNFLYMFPETIIAVGITNSLLRFF